MNLSIKEYKWKLKDFQIFSTSCKKYLDLKDLQFYNPIFSLYFHYHNTKNANKIIDLYNKYHILQILESENYKYYNSNKICNCNIYDKQLNITINKDLFIKCIHLIDPIHIMMNNYNLNNTLLPNNYTYNYNNKINNLNNSAYIDAFFCYLMSNLVLHNKLLHFPIFYSSINGILNEYNFDISEEYSDFINEKWFHKNIGNSFTIDMYINDTDSNDTDSNDTDSNNSDLNNIDDNFVSKLPNCPVQYIFLEKLEGTLEDFLEIENINTELIKSCLFQIIFTLAYLQKHFKFTHNDLHINNIMYITTKLTYIYYKYNNIYFKVPTHGYIFKIIDFGRIIFTFKNKTFFNDVYSKYGEAEGQYHYPIPNVPLYDNDRYKLDIKPNYSFDMCRLSTTMLDYIYEKNEKNENNENNEKNELYQFLNDIVIDKNNNNIYENMSDNFDLYIDIAKNAINGLPHELLQKDIFKEYRTKKKLFPKKEYYGMD